MMAGLRPRVRPESAGPVASDTLVEAALKILNQPVPEKKAAYTVEACKLWRERRISRVCAPRCKAVIPDRPARADDKVRLVAPFDMPKLGKGGTLSSRQALVHSMVHIESWAVDLAWDMVARAGQQRDVYLDLPDAFFDDFVTVAEDECRHFLMLQQRLEELGSYYGALPAHDGLWESAINTAGNLAARLAVEHCVHEARGLDVMPGTIGKFRRNGDEVTAQLLEGVIYPEEVTHCGAGVRWLKHLHDQACKLQQQQQQQQSRSILAASAEVASTPTTGSGESHDGQEQATTIPAWAEEAATFPNVESWFHHLTRTHFKGSLKPPFNDEARAKAGFLPSWYLPLARATVSVTE